MSELIAELEDEGLRLDVFLAEGLPELSRSRIQKLIAEGLVTADGLPVQKSHRIRSGEVFEVGEAEVRPTEIRPEEIPLDILYEDDDLIVLNKPKGMVVHPAPGHSGGTLVNALLAHCGNSLSGIGGVLRPGIVHRLDKDTSGLMLAAKNDRAHISLSDQLRDRSLSRVYEAILRGTPNPESGTVDAPIGRHPTDRKKMAVMQQHSRRAVTHYELLERFPGFSYVQCRLETGRTHQIRVHMAHIGHPVAGDPLYGGGNVPELSSQCLHARRIRFIHPRTGEAMSFECGLPDEFLALLERLRREEERR